MERYSALVLSIALAVASAVAATWQGWFLLLTALFSALSMLGAYDLLQHRHAILRNYPVIGHMRFLFEGIRPEIRQYLIESDQDEEPFSRDDRSLVYQRAKGVEDKRPFGTRERVYDAGYEWLTHSMVPVHIENATSAPGSAGRTAANPMTPRSTISRR